MNIPSEPDRSRYKTVADLLRRHARIRPDKPFLISIDQDGLQLTFSELWRFSNRIARFLADRGVGSGGRIAVLSDNRLETLALYYGIQRYGAAFCTIDIEVNAHHIREMLRRIEPDLVLCHESFGSGDPGWIRFGEPPGAASGAGILPEFAVYDDTDDTPVPDGAPDDLCVVSFTSGTSAAPKGVLHTFDNYFWIADQAIDMWRLTDSDRMLEYRSFGWASSHMLSLQPALVCGATLVFARRFSQSRFFDWIRIWRPTMAIGVPAVINMLLERAATAEDRAAMRSLRFMSSSTAPLLLDRHRRFEETYGVELVQLYGMSEGGIVASNHVGQRRIGSVGRPGLYQNLRIVGPDGEALPIGETGEIEIGGAQTGWGYLHADGTMERIRGERLKTGDLGRFDEDGFLTVTGRTRDVIIRGGVNISPLEIDNALVSLPEVAEAAAIGAPDAVYGEEIVAFVAPQPGERATAEEIAARCAELLPGFKAPKRVILVEELPKNDRGKIDRSVLKKMWARDYAER